MIYLKQSLQAWRTPAFHQTLKEELAQLDASSLPLQQGISQGSYCSDSTFGVMPLSASEEPEGIRLRLGIFYSSIIAGCNCADDPTPVEELNEYCEVQIVIDRKTAEATITLLD